MLTNLSRAAQVNAIKRQSCFIWEVLKGIFRKHGNDAQISYSEYILKYNISAKHLIKKRNQLRKRVLFYMLCALVMLCYSIYLLLYVNWYSFLLGFSVLFVLLSLAFKYHFWLFQLDTKKFGCSFKDWLKYLSVKK